MASQGPFSASILAEQDNGGLAWNFPMNVLSDDSVYASATLDGSTQGDYLTNNLALTNFGFSIPADATIDGVVVEVDGGTTSESLFIVYAELTKNGSNAASTTRNEGLPMGSFGYRTLGSSTDLWLTTWTQAEINASTFGVIFHVEIDGFSTAAVQIDHARITVYYTEGATGQMAYADADIDTTGWTPTPLYQQIDETVPSDTDFITSTAV